MNASSPYDIILDPFLRYDQRPRSAPSTPGTAFLTGATGFLGTHLLADLLAHTSLDVLCLTRDSGSDARARLKQVLEAQALWDGRFESHIHPIVGDLKSPRFGLSDSRFLALGKEVDIIYHNAAQTNFILPYRALKAANVAGTHEVLRLASISPPKAFHFVSSTKVFGALKYATFLALSNQVCKEDFRVPGPAPTGSGYAESKWVAERLVNAAAERGLAASIYRPGMITGDSRTGASNLDDIFSLTMKGCLLLGAAPDLDAQIHLTPVDFISRAIVELSLGWASSGKAFHMMNPVPISWRQVIEAMRRVGSVKQTVPYAEWRVSVIRRGREGGEPALQSLSAVLSELRPPFASAPRILAQENTTNGLAATPAIRYPQDSMLLLDRYIEHLRRAIVSAQSA
jgi:thioester reductase-like protein